MNKKLIINKTVEYVKHKMAGEGSGHDWWHVYRVWNLAKKLAKAEKADFFTVELGALLHDISDWKFNNGNSKKGSMVADLWLSKNKVDSQIIDEIKFVIENMSYKGGTNSIKMRTLEGKIIQDADRLDAIGAIGIARAFAFGGYVKGEMYNPEIKPKKFKNFNHYRKSMSKNTVINHFYEKLFLLADLMNTKSAKKIAIRRHRYMKDYLDKFYSEWNGKDVL